MLANATPGFLEAFDRDFEKFFLLVGSHNSAMELSICEVPRMHLPVMLSGSHNRFDQANFTVIG